MKDKNISTKPRSPAQFDRLCKTLTDIGEGLVANQQYEGVAEEIDLARSGLSRLRTELELPTHKWLAGEEMIQNDFYALKQLAKYNLVDHSSVAPLGSRMEGSIRFLSQSP